MVLALPLASAATPAGMLTVTVQPPVMPLISMLDLLVALSGSTGARGVDPRRRQTHVARSARGRHAEAVGAIGKRHRHAVGSSRGVRGRRAEQREAAGVAAVIEPHRTGLRREPAEDPRARRATLCD